MKTRATLAPKVEAITSNNASAMLKALAEQIRMWRKRHSMTQADLALRSGISVSFISMIERAERSPSYETLFEVARALDIPISELFRGENEPPIDDGYFRKLVDFARGVHLSRRQVEQLIAVGRAMYDLADPGAPVAERVPAGRRCSVSGCNRPLLAKGLCPSHYRRKQRQGAAK
ncbi:MAG: helix-turn-helix transcriptional regulator [Deltaproteobacteria bacterium]|nr:helix-turn-helix transcriptional regulator [Deltaproteobacteria bacterium]